MTKVKKWLASAATIALLVVAGYYVGDFDEQKGYPVYNPLTQDTIWVAASARMVEVADSIYRASPCRLLLVKSATERKGLNELGDVVGIFPLWHQFTRAELAGFDTLTVALCRDSLSKMIEGSAAIVGPAKYRYRVKDSKAATVADMFEWREP